jgi:hypothetical protein
MASRVSGSLIAIRRTSYVHRTTYIVQHTSQIRYNATLDCREVAALPRRYISCRLTHVVEGHHESCMQVHQSVFARGPRKLVSFEGSASRAGDSLEE